MTDEDLARLAGQITRLGHRRNDRRLLQARDRLLRFYIGPPQGEFWELINRFDHVVVDRRQTGELKRYALAHELLSEAAGLLKQEKIPA